ncbi:hypothetical protein PoB_005839700 [Plakobranchus ocellatus]|uniref:Uncharacterized protein n=1 Tax=Plakobranchus ocellatus TaxID=259542 RepID=A0AAV4CKI6_9GAST|nr:hypothetical protein PoB_005839700 [Plakobranchus ocellatus]
MALDTLLENITHLGSASNVLYDKSKKKSNKRMLCKEVHVLERFAVAFTKGQQHDTLKCTDRPFRLAVLDSSGASNCITVAVTSWLGSPIHILEVVDDTIKAKKILQTSRWYNVVAAVNKQSLAVADTTLDHPGIDLIDLDGRVIRQICSGVWPRYMDVTDNGELVFSATYNKIVRVKVDTGAVVFANSGLSSL